ncbi:hypothetical protein RF11_06048 [Thelohanellus kitauei]|uniref:Uncharacterized protein n=1 Tax=Thelohanellus kitauei TaxID=669202 RepID=A0A0C2N6K4_THEKT|nr:hypothetical protein RF11_06048 [Thelohanellus kitauei]
MFKITLFTSSCSDFLVLYLFIMLTASGSSFGIVTPLNDFLLFFLVKRSMSKFFDWLLLIWFSRMSCDAKYWSFKLAGRPKSMASCFPVLPIPFSFIDSNNVCS